MKRIFFIIILFFLFTPKVFGADFSFETAPEVSAGKIFTVGVFVDTQNHEINSAEIKLNFDSDKLDFLGFKEGGVINLWINLPKENSAGQISMSGIIPGGVIGTYDPNYNDPQKLLLVNLLFMGKNSGNADFNFTSTKVLKNDGLGTELGSINHNKSIFIKADPTRKNIENKENQDLFDNTPPKEFQVYFSQANIDANTPDLIIFSAEDLDSGIAKYQIYHAGRWQDIDSPAIVKRGFFERKITIRAVDFAGNVRDSQASIPGDVSLMAFIWLLLIIVFGFYASKLLKYKYGKKP